MMSGRKNTLLLAFCDGRWLLVDSPHKELVQSISHLYWYPKQIVEPTAELPMIWDTISVMEGYYNILI